MTDVGYRTPPISTRFPKGRSGNPKGRPKGRRREPPYEAVLGQIVTIKEDGVERRSTVAEAFLLHLTKRALETGGAAAAYAMAALEQARAARAANGLPEITAIVRVIVTPGSLNPALKPLRMATKVDRYRRTAKVLLEPWIAEEALARFGPKRLPAEQQMVVVQAVRAPHKVRWPDWWKVRPWEAGDSPNSRLK